MRTPGAAAFFKRTISAQLHWLGFLFAIAGLFVLLHYVQAQSEFSHFFACIIYGLTSVLIFGVSAVFHTMSDGFSISAELEKRMEDLDHLAVYLFIAGTYTPLIINAISPPWNEVLLWLVWSVAIGGIVYTHFRDYLPIWARHRYVNTAIFVLMGWLLVIRVGEILDHLSERQVYFLFAGGASYTIGAVIYALKRPNPWAGVFGYHELWHLMVLLGFGFHYFMILNFYL